MEILKKPVISEKATKISEKLNRYTFIVDKSANKITIAKAIAEMYSVTVASVNTMNYMGKNRQRYRRGASISGKKASFKKAIITLAPGETIDLFASV